MCGVRMVLGTLALIGALGITPFAVASTRSAEEILHSFSGPDGENPEAPLIMDSAGNLFGTTIEGGSQNGGTIFKFAPDGTVTVLHSFARSQLPKGSLLLDENGNLYGTTYHGGNACADTGTCGTAFKLAPDGTYTLLHAFNGDDGAHPNSGLIADSDGNLYGTTMLGGVCGIPNGCGTIYRLAPDGTEAVLYRFSGADGMFPLSNLVSDTHGNLYGTTWLGGIPSPTCPGGGCGTVFKFSKSGKETILYNFCSVSNCADGSNPDSDIALDKMGNIYGTTPQGGVATDCPDCGVAFKLSPSGTYTVLYNFCSTSRCRDNPRPQGPIVDKLGNLYGSTEDKNGTIFKITPDGAETTIYKFRCNNKMCVDGVNPVGRLLADKKFHKLYGVTDRGGEFGAGAIFAVTP